MDRPQDQLRAIVLPADPVPISQPRTEPFFNDETNIRYTQGGTVDAVTNIPIPGGNQRATQGNALLPIIFVNTANKAIVFIGDGGGAVTFVGSQATVDARLRVTQQTGEPPGGLNQLPGTVDPADTDGVNVPPGNDDVPMTGPLAGSTS